MTRPIRWVPLVAGMALVVTVAGCTGADPSPSPSAAPLSPTAAVAPGATASDPTATPDQPASSLGEPPAATLAAEGGDPIAGSLGAFTWGDGGSDGPWLPGARIAVGTGESLTASLAGDVPVAGWTVKRVAAGSSDGIGAVPIGDGAAPPITFTAPPPGAWSVQVVVTFRDELGSATYYWAVTAT